MSGGIRNIAVKHDDQTNALYGGNKVRKLEYIFQRALDRGAKRVATFGTVGSNHALATAIHARITGLGCTCFLAHQARTANIPATLDRHLDLGTEIVRWGGGVDQLTLYRRFLQKRNTWVIPVGGSCWLGAVGFVNAGLELAAQIQAGELAVPDRIYMANGSMGSVSGLALGLTLADIRSEIHAIQVADNRFANRKVLGRLINKTAGMLNRLDSSIPADAAARANIVWRDDFYAGGYAHVDVATENAVVFAKDELRLALETTYTGKAMAALQHDLETCNEAPTVLFWNTYNSAPPPVMKNMRPERHRLPEQFRRYYR